MSKRIAALGPVVGPVVAQFRHRWKQLFLTDIVYKVIAFILLTPLVASLFHIFMMVSGDAILADQDVVYFFLRPLGLLCLVTVAAVWLGIVALELATLMAILAAGADQHVGLLEAHRFASLSAWRVGQVTIRLIARTLLVLAPFLAVAAAVYWMLLTQYDINYYLKEKPPAFMIAVGIGTVLGVAAVATLLRLFTGWFFALPLVLFEDVRPDEALGISRQRAKGHRRVLLMWIVGWFLATTLVSALATALVIEVGKFFVPRATGSFELLTVAVGASLLVWTVVNLAVNLLSTTTFASLYFYLYRGLGSDGPLNASGLRIAAANGNRSAFQITKKRLLAAGIVGTLVAMATGLVAMQSVRPVDDVKIMAHRGSSKAAPENTMAAVRQAIADGADWVEIDVQETADGEIVVFHDSDFMKLAGVDLKIWDATLADLKDIDIGSWFDANFESERVPTLAQVLDECRGKIGVNIELKYYGHDDQLEQRVVDIVESHKMTEDVVFMSLKIDAVKKMKSIRPQWKTGLLMSVAAGALNRIDADFLAVNASFVDRGFIREAHDGGKEVYVWTVNDAITMSTMIGRGVDGLITDEPARARSVLQQRATMSAPQRLLVELAQHFGVSQQISEQ